MSKELQEATRAAIEMTLNTWSAAVEQRFGEPHHASVQVREGRFWILAVTEDCFVLSAFSLLPPIHKGKDTLVDAICVMENAPMGIDEVVEGFKQAGIDASWMKMKMQDRLEPDFTNAECFRSFYKMAVQFTNHPHN